MHALCSDCCKDLVSAALAGGSATFRCPVEGAGYDAKAGVEFIPLHADAMSALHQLQELEEYCSPALGNKSPRDPSPDPNGCDECANPAVWYCTRCDATLCEEHSQSRVQRKHRGLGLLLPLGEREAYLAARTPCGTSLCKQHLLPEALLCTLCNVACCQTCSLHSPEHRDHSNQGGRNSERVRYLLSARFLCSLLTFCVLVPL